MIKEHKITNGVEKGDGEYLLVFLYNKTKGKCI